MVFVKKLSFLPCGFLGKPRQKSSFFNTLNRKEYYLSRKVKFQNIRKIEFFKVDGFCEKIDLLPGGFFRPSKAEKIVF